MNTQETRLVVSEDNNKMEEKECEMSIPKYEMTKQELRLQEEEQKFNIYMSTFSYEGDDLDLDSEMDMESESHAYPFLD